MYSVDDDANAPGFPIQKSTDQRVLSPPRSLSQSATSFIASRCQGIHQMLLICLRTAHATRTNGTPLIHADQSRRPFETRQNRSNSQKPKPMGDAQNLNLNSTRYSLSGSSLVSMSARRKAYVTPTRMNSQKVCIYAGHTSMRKRTCSRTPGILCKSSSVSGVARQNLVANTSNYDVIVRGSFLFTMFIQPKADYLPEGR